MLNDKDAAQQISRSLRMKLSNDEEQEIQGHLESNSQSRAFAQLSEIIQNSVAEFAIATREGDEENLPSLPADAKQRLRDSVQLAIESGADRSQPTSERRVDDTFAINMMLRQGENDSSLMKRQIASRFTLIKKIGGGGLGNVWLARDEKINRNVAIKELRPEALEMPRAWKRFHREAEITGNLEHPNIVPLYMFGIDSVSQEPFYAMRFVGKRTLQEAIVEHHERVRQGEDRRMGLHRLLSAFLDVCQAVAYAHSRGVIHRDLKPDNVALDNFGQVIVLDWGLAKLVDDGELCFQLTSDATMSDSALSRTMTGEVVGTPVYMAPEQAAGDTDNVERRTDVYGLGAILFAILTGHAPHDKLSFSGASTLTDSTMQEKVKELLKTIAENESPAAADFDAVVPRDLDAICRKAMSRKPYLRFESAAELAGEVEKWMAGQNEKQRYYDNMRMEGRELCGRVQSAVRDLETNTRFMSRLPPIQEFCRAESQEDQNIWRDRLATIFIGLLQSNVYYESVTYYRVQGDQSTELTRVERHSTDLANVRKVPKSRLVTGPMSPFHQRVADQKPEEVLVGFICEDQFSCEQMGRSRTNLVAAVPVYDEATEELFGVVAIEGNFEKIFDSEARQRMLSATQVFVTCQSGMILTHQTREGRQDQNFLKKLLDVEPAFGKCVAFLQQDMEYIDDADREIYGAKIWLEQSETSLSFLLSQR